ncbi:cache domain-containing protein [Ideonella sp. 4Y11]|uniref:histidine kinase n=1 Tax=Ideonella aquatica TaxID=2824119 RepID=A0A940YEI0_9BURK|nr:cache domain-containing protein [Ideonella aquatica]MBQ0957819.1 cache domain-containing protein [Ideonella aquatica]
MRTALQAWPVRRKLLALVLLPLWAVLPLLGVALLVWGNEALDRLLVAKVRSDLAVADGYFERMLAEVGASTNALAESRVLAEGLARRDDTALVQLLGQLQRRERLDLLVWRDAHGRSPQPGADTLPRLPPPAAGRPRASVERLAPEAQAALPAALRERIPVPLLPTQNAAPTDRRTEDRALMAMAVAEVRAADGRLLGQLQSGVLLNRNLAFIDQLNEVVYPAGSLPWGSQGTATLFLDDVRISTNVRLFGGEAHERAIGTRVSGSVRERVLGQGETWLDRAFVVSDWYVSGYRPLIDHAGQRVGMLYVGFLERPFGWLKYAALAMIGSICFGVMIPAGLLAWRWARGVVAPLERMSATMQRQEGGDSAARVGPVARTDEIGQLAAHFDHLLDTLAGQTQALQRWNAELDAKVAERGRELEAAQAQLLRAEKLAAVGQLTASIAHEVNNPIAVIQGNLDLMRELLGPAAAPVREELALIDSQIERMRLIVTQLLQFARPGEYAGYVEKLDPRRVLDDCLVLVAHLLARQHIRIEREDRATGLAAINRQELQQVLVNLLVNAVQAMPEGGTLTLRTDDWPEGPGVVISVADTGEGLPPDMLTRLFQPFVTRKPDGTGLGLWISRSLVERYGGELRAANVPGPSAELSGGAEFSVWLRSALTED